MFEIIIAIVVIYWIVQSLLIDDVVWAAIITAAIVFLFFNIDFEKETIDVKTEAEIKQSLDKAHDAGYKAIEKAGEISENAGRAFADGQEKAREDGAQ